RRLVGRGCVVDRRERGERLRRRIVTLTLTQIRELLATHGVHPSKALGQHFLADPNTSLRIVRLARVEAGDRVLEIGPGVGSLTVALLDAGARVRAVELDQHVLPILSSVTAGRDIDIVVGDARNLDWRATLDSESWKLVANLPYNVATTIVIDALERAPMIESMLVMVQREVGERLAAAPGDDAYGAVSVKIAYYSEAKVVGRVPPTVFLPRPKVESALVELRRRSAPPVAVRDVDRMFMLVRAGFATRRKTLRRALAGVVDEAVFAAASVEPSARAETLALDDWARLSDAS
ncbi:MAG TPA: 16S rRNA (adenine(1518)-N(6)/adenine(1519)-N(6))-dimethyltransferase RsmA, partial [Acidimicrobiia bacterium]|nr:16S rRNA (adenine(1518)-N(6)/adenine(1519)-N(6))-dimethyltransferase RsmA [Acidimicrobiia bacterium]